jgi:hypothetical protein
MAALNEETWKFVLSLNKYLACSQWLNVYRLVQMVEKEIHAALGEKDLTWRNLGPLIAQYLPCSLKTMFKLI